MNVKRNLLTSVLLSALVGGGVGVASAADQSGADKLGLLGTQVQSRPDSAKVIKISGATGAVYVDHFATVKFENDKGQNFVWAFDSAMQTSSFPLKAIAPGGFDAGATQVSIVHPGSHFAN